MALPNVLSELGPCEVIWDISGTPITLTPSAGGVTIKSEVKTSPYYSDQAGENSIGEVVTGEGCTIEMKLSQMTAARLVTMASMATQGTTIKFGGEIGSDLGNDAKKLYIKPIVDGVVTTDESAWITVFKATKPIPKMSTVFDAKGQRVWDCTIMCFPGTITGYVGALYCYGKV